MNKNFIKIVLTGGPCSGKTTLSQYLYKKLSKIKYKVVCIPEAATLLYNAKVEINKFKMSNQERYLFQTSLMKLIISLEG